MKKSSQYVLKLIRDTLLFTTIKPGIASSKKDNSKAFLSFIESIASANKKSKDMNICLIYPKNICFLLKNIVSK